MFYSFPDSQRAPQAPTAQMQQCKGDGPHPRPVLTLGSTHLRHAREDHLSLHASGTPRNTGR